MRVVSKAGLIAILVATVCRAIASEAPPPVPLALDATNLASVIDPLMAEWIDKQKGAGAVIAVTTRDHLIFAKGYGFADTAAQRPFTADATLVRPGSISKLVTAIAVMQLVDQGTLDLDRNANDYLDFVIPVPEGGVPVTLRRLLRHRAGFEEHAKNLFSRNLMPQSLGRWLKRSLPPRLFPRGDITAYSNYGFGLAGYIVERASGEPFADYVARHIFEPLGMTRTTFLQPIPDVLAPMAAKGYRLSDRPLGFFETISDTPAGALSATAIDMARFVRALLNGGTLEGARILSRERFDEMMSPPGDATGAGYLGLAFFGLKRHGYETLGHGGGTMAFLSDLEVFRGPALGVFVSFDGMGAAKDAPEIVNAIADRFLPKLGEAEIEEATSCADTSKLEGVWHPTRRAESTFLKFSDLISQLSIAVDQQGHASVTSAAWPFGERFSLKCVGPNLYEGPRNLRFAFEETNSGKLIAPAMQFQQVVWHENARFVGPVLVTSTLLLILTVLAWPATALWRRWRKKTFSENAAEKRMRVMMRLLAVIDVAAITAALIFFFLARDFTLLADSLDPFIVLIYILAWLGVLSAIPAVWIVVSFWRKSAGSWWARAHHTLIAASMVVMAWFFVTFHIAGTTLNY